MMKHQDKFPLKSFERITTKTLANGLPLGTTPIHEKNKNPCVGVRLIPEGNVRFSSQELLPLSESNELRSYSNEHILTLGELKALINTITLPDDCPVMLAKDSFLGSKEYKYLREFRYEKKKEDKFVLLHLRDTDLKKEGSDQTK